MTEHAPAVTHQILDVVRRRTGLHFRTAQHAHVVAAIGRAMQRAGATKQDDYVVRLEKDINALDALVVELVVGETYFFRFPEQYQFVVDTILPSLGERADRNRPLRFWSAGCATGEEAYSLAILLREANLLDSAQILATDISKPALEHARRGVYRDWALRGNGRQRVAPHATSHDGFYELASEIRQAVKFAHLNLALDTYPSLVTGTGNQDVIFCRNVLIYLDPAAIGDVAVGLFESLAPGGWLVTAASDPVLDTYAPFQTVDAAGGVYYQRPPEAVTEDIAYLDAAAALDLPRSPVRSAMSSDNGTATALEQARAALRAGQYLRAAELTATCTAVEAAACLHIQALANSDTDLAQKTCQQILAQHPCSAELHYLHGVLLMEQRQEAEALEKFRKVLFLDRSHVLAHLTMGTLLRRAGDLAGAQRAFRNARDLCEKRDADQAVPMADSETYGSVCRAATVQLASLASATEATR